MAKQHFAKFIPWLKVFKNFNLATTLEGWKLFIHKTCFINNFYNIHLKNTPRVNFFLGRPIKSFDNILMHQDKKNSFSAVIEFSIKGGSIVMVKGALFGQNMWIFLLIPLSSVLSKVPTLISYNPYTTEHPSFAQVISSLYIYPDNDS